MNSKLRRRFRRPRRSAASRSKSTAAAGRCGSIVRSVAPAITPASVNSRWTRAIRRRSLPATGYRETIARCGIIVVEGFNDVLGLDAIGVPAVAIMSNKITDEQVAKVERFAKSLAGGKVTLLFDADDAGDTGAKEALWLFAQHGLDVRLGWSQAMHGGKFKGRQPEILTSADWQFLWNAIRP